MPYNRPTLTAIRDRIQGGINSKIIGADARLRNNFLNLIANAQSGASHSHYGFQAFMFKQLFPDTAESEFLERWSSIWGIFKKAATKGSGPTKAIGTNGVVISTGEALTDGAGVEYVTTADATITAGEAILEVEAVEEGADGNQVSGTILTFVATPAQVDTNTVVESAGITGGANLEEDEDLLTRLLFRIQNPPQGGADTDYVLWALEVPGVTRAWVYPLELGPGEVTVRFMMDDTYADGIPLAGDVTTVQDYIETKRPVTADVTVVAPIATALDLNITLNLGDTSAIRAAIEAEFVAMVKRDAIPSGTIYLSRINEAISTAQGEFDHILNSPVANVTHTTGLIATPGTVTFT